ncbi:MAG: ribosomal-processing cysteine protease Prp [Treponemataceae bacterium]|nr:ribosomal-processing cysteine protease Prp [Treponemataceae bacterium]
MTTVTLVCGKDGAFRSCEAAGHAGFAAKGSDIVCAAGTILLRTAVDVLSGMDGVVVRADTTVRGELAFAVVRAAAEKTERLVCTADFLERGLRSLQSEYPQFVRLQKIVQ